VQHMVSERERVRALLDQALAEARSHCAGRIVALHFVVYGPSPEIETSLRRILEELSIDTLAEGAQIITRAGPSRFICWNCCALRFESDDEEAVCPNCGHRAELIPVEITCALDHIEVAAREVKKE
jgi:Zn finger protein HypA/HybF involved in hydrogenase expression